MSTTETWTIGKLLNWTTEFLEKHGASSPRLDAEVLLSHARECQRIQLYTAFEDEPTDEQKTAFREMVRRRSEGTPVAYLVGYKEFYSDTFTVNPDVLIPRPETEHLVVEAIDRAAELRAESSEQGRTLRIVDVGTGSGVIAIELARHVDDCQVMAIDQSETALTVARSNAEKFELSEQIDFVHSDLLTAAGEQASEQCFDIIVSNPPYITEEEFANLDLAVRDFEPKSALVGGPKGYELIVQLLAQAHSLLADGGFVIIEFSPMLAEKTGEFVDSDKWNIEKITKDLAGLARVITLKKT